MTKQTWFNKGYIAFDTGQPKMLPWEPGAKHFNDGWEDAYNRDYLEERECEQSELEQDIEGLKARICGYGESLDLDELASLLYEMGARS